MMSVGQLRGVIGLYHVLFAGGGLYGYMRHKRICTRARMLRQTHTCKYISRQRAREIKSKRASAQDCNSVRVSVCLRQREQ